MSSISQKELDAHDGNFSAVEYGIMFFLILIFIEVIASRF